MAHKQFEASGDLRNVVETVNGIPNDFKQKCTIVINDKDPTIIIRNAIFLLLAFIFQDGEASELIVHLWYSASLPSQMWRGVTEKVMPFIRDLIIKHQMAPDDKLSGKYGTSAYLAFA